MTALLLLLASGWAGYTMRRYKRVNRPARKDRAERIRSGQTNRAANRPGPGKTPPGCGCG